MELQLPGYKVLRQIGAGGMGQVLLGERVDSGAKVAIKIASAELGEEGLGRLRQEVNALSQVKCPDLPAFHEALSLPDGGLALVMDFVEGRSLTDVCAGRSPQQRLEILRKVLPGVVRALLAMHQAGIVHRDLKPDNILVRPDGSGVLVDLGLAHAEDVARLTRTGMIVGTPAYMAPEQLEGKIRFTPATDLYQVAMIIVRLLSGEPVPKEQEAVQELVRRQRSDSAVFDSVLSVVPLGWTDWLEKALLSKAQERPEVESHLQALLQLGSGPFRDPPGGQIRTRNEVGKGQNTGLNPALRSVSQPSSEEMRRGTKVLTLLSGVLLGIGISIGLLGGQESDGKVLPATWKPEISISNSGWTPQVRVRGVPESRLLRRVESGERGAVFSEPVSGEDLAISLGAFDPRAQSSRLFFEKKQGSVEVAEVDLREASSTTLSEIVRRIPPPRGDLFRQTNWQRIWSDLRADEGTSALIGEIARNGELIRQLLESSWIPPEKRYRFYRRALPLVAAEWFFFQSGESWASIPVIGREFQPRLRPLRAWQGDQQGSWLGIGKPLPSLSNAGKGLAELRAAHRFGVSAEEQERNPREGAFFFPGPIPDLENVWAEIALQTSAVKGADYSAIEVRVGGSQYPILVFPNKAGGWSFSGIPYRWIADQKTKNGLMVALRLSDKLGLQSPETVSVVQARLRLVQRSS